MARPTAYTPDLAAAILARGIRTPRGKTTWAPTQVARVLARAAAGTA